MMMGIRWPSRARRRWSCRPSMPGMLRSSTRHPVLHGASDPRNSSADAKAATCSPTDRRRPSSACRIDSSSSTTETTRSGLMDGYRTARGAGCLAIRWCDRTMCWYRSSHPPGGGPSGELFDHPHQLGERGRAHLLHDVAAMNLDRDLADAQLGGNLLVEQASDDQGQHLTLA